MAAETKRKPQLHEVLAVVGDLEGMYNKILEETAVTFGKRQHLFSGHNKQYEPFNEEEKETLSHTDSLKVDTTVDDKLNYMFTHVNKYLDAAFQKEATNQEACGDIIVNGETIAEKLPAPFLLGLEKRMKQLRGVFNQIPTLEPGIEWEEDDSQGKGIYKTSEPVTQFRTKKVPKSKVLYEATKEHRAEIEKWYEEENIGKFLTTRYSGAITPAAKSELLSRIDKLTAAIKQARQRANCQEVKGDHVSHKLMNFIMKG